MAERTHNTAGGDLAAIARLVDALRPWLDHLVIVGGWAHRLHRLHPEARVPAYRPLRTRDADVAFSPADPLAGDIGAALRAAGFRAELSSDHRPPVTQYRLGDEGDPDRGFYAEFLAPLRGSGVRRDGTEDATVARAGVTAQKLRYLDLLLIRPWAVRLDAAAGAPLPTPADVRIADPVAFVAQKLLIQSARPPAKRAQDALYVHDTLELFSPALDALQAEWREHLRPTLPAKTAALVERSARELFESVTDVLRAAARIPQDRTLTPERLRAVGAYGLARIFGAASERAG